MKKKEKNKESVRLKKARFNDFCIIGSLDGDTWKVYSKEDGTLLNQRAWKDIRVINNYLYLIDDNDRYSFGVIKENQLTILASELRYVSWIDEGIFELTNQQHQKAIYKADKCIIDYGVHKDFDYDIEFDPTTGKNKVKIIGIDLPREVRWMNIVQQSEKGYVVKDGDDYAFYDTNGELVLDFEYQDIKLFDDHVEATRKIFFD